jgi:NitT/TauT family transport system permease protein
MVSATGGLGYVLLDAQQTFRTERVFAGLIVIGFVGFVTDLGFRVLRRRMMPGTAKTER